MPDPRPDLSARALQRRAYPPVESAADPGAPGLVGARTVPLNVWRVTGVSGARLAVRAAGGLILPVGPGLPLWVGWRRRDLLDGHRCPVWLLGLGTLAWLVTLSLGWDALRLLGDL